MVKEFLGSAAGRSHANTPYRRVHIPLRVVGPFQSYANAAKKETSAHTAQSSLNELEVLSSTKHQNSRARPNPIPCPSQQVNKIDRVF